MPSDRLFLAAGLFVCLLPAATGQQTATAPGKPPSAQAAAPSSATPLTPAEYAARLGVLEQLVAACQAAPSAGHCAVGQVDPDLQLQLPAGARQIRFTWLRAILEEAAQPPKAETTPAAKKKTAVEEDSGDLQLDQLPSLHDRLSAARARLAAERVQAQLLVRQSAAQSSAPQAASDPRRSHLASILAGKDYHAIKPGQSLSDRIREKIQEWLLRLFRAISQASRGRRWIGITAEIVFIALLLIALLWFLIRLERQGRFVNASLTPGLGAASLRDWQLWLEDSSHAAARGAWRDAVHLLYWASISRLESSGLWPADRARTPREYLALLAPGHAQRSALLALTRTFERTWYAGRPATEADFLQAEQQAGQLGARRSEQPRAAKAGSQ